MSREEAETEKISIVIPAYNCEGTIERCVASAFSQSYENVEVIAVDDGSTDRTAEILDGLKKTHPGLRVIRKENGGVSSARNEGMRAAKGAWLVTLDADDYIDRDMLKTMHGAALRSGGQLVMCGFRMIYPDGKKELRQAPADFEGSRSELLNMMFLELYDKHLFHNQNNKLYRLDIIRDYDIFYDPAMQINEDLWFSLRFLSCCSEVAVLRRAFLNYTQHGEGESLVTKFHDNCVDTCFQVLAAYDSLFNGCHVSDEIINKMNNRMLFLICGYAGWQYYKSGYTDAQMLENIRRLCANDAFQRLLSETDPMGLKNRTAHFLLKHRFAKVYHTLCKILYRGKRKLITPGDLTKENPEENKEHGTE